MDNLRPTFTHLHVHSHFSLLRGTASVEQLVARAASEGMTHLALTDSQALYGSVAFDRACRAAGIQPILGMTVIVAPATDSLDASAQPDLLVLLATGPEGYRSLCRLASLIQAHPERAAKAVQGLSWDELEAHAAGLLCLDGGRLGGIERRFRAGDAEGAACFASRLQRIYAGSAFVSLEIHRPEDRAIAQAVEEVGHRHGLESLAVQPVYCLAAEDRERLRLLAAIGHNLPIAELPSAALPAGGGDLHWLPLADIQVRFAGFRRALANIEQVTARCQPALPDGSPVWPDLNLPHGQEPDSALAALAQGGLEVRYGPNPSAGVTQRLQAELDAIAHHGYAPLFLVVADITRYAREQRVPVNTRGSVANSLVAYCSGITNVDPIAHDLLFERFLNPARADLPDIDVDFCSRRRDEVLDYVRRTHGPDRVALVSTVSTLQPRGAVRETGKAYGLSEPEIDRLVTLLPRHWHPDPRRRDRRTVDDVLAELPNPLHRQVIQQAYTLIDQPHHLSVHPGGVVITPSPLTDWVPLQWAPKGFVITQFAHGDVEAIGLPKIDLLGIRALTVLAEAEDLVRRHHDGEFSLDQIPKEDAPTARALCRGETIGVFQCESEGARRTLLKLQARSVRDLAVANAFFKPGPATGGMAATFVRRYRGEEAVTYLHPAPAPILEPTKGVLIFQEQILRVAREIAGLTWAQADQLRRGMSHFGRQEMAELRSQFIEGCCRPAPQGPGFHRRQAETLWEQVQAFAGYGFNQGHATSYAGVSYRSTYLKVHWPAAFLCARLAHWGGFHHPAIYMAEAVRLGLAVRPPHVNHSGRRFTLGWEGEQAVLWMGLGQVRDLRQTSIRALLTQRRERPFADARDLWARVPLQRKEIAHLIQCGALDGLGESRAALLAQAGEVQRAGSAQQMMFDFATPSIPPESAHQRLVWEKRLLGQPVSVHPLEIVAERLPEHISLESLTKGARGPVAGVRLPGWTGGQGFFLGDGHTFVTARLDPSQKNPEPWQPLLLRGRWQRDEWGISWLQVDDLERIPLPGLRDSAAESTDRGEGSGPG